MQIRAERPVGFRLSCVWLFAATAFLAACTPENPIEYENSQAGTPQAVWDVAGAGDPTIQGFATEISVNKGQTISFKVDTDASAYRLDIYRMGWYQGNGARLITSVLPSAVLPQAQPDCLTDPTGLIDCGNWAVSASWVVPGNLVSGIYFARLVRTDTNGASHVFFVVRDDGRNAPILFQTSDTTWHAYNDYGGNSLSSGNPPVGRAYKVSYNRPLVTRGLADGENSVMNAEYPLVRWLERQNYDVAYTSGVDAERAGATMLTRKVYLSVGHDEYWSGTQRANVEAAIAAGVNVAFLSGNTAFWKTRFEPSIDAGAQPHRTLVCYKETLENAVVDPASPIWTGSWRDPRFSPPGDGGRPENALAGSLFRIGGPFTGAITLTGAEGRMRPWRATGLDALPLEDVVTLAPGSLGARVDVDEDNGFRPPGLAALSATPVSSPDRFLTDFGGTYGAGSATHRITLHRHPVSGAQVFSTGSAQWSWGLDANHDRNVLGATTDLRMMQATVNVLADMGAAPKVLQPGLVYSTPTADTLAPSAAITFPAEAAEIPLDTLVTITGTASDPGGFVAGVEVSTDGGTTWHPATGRESWSYAWLAGTVGAASLRARAVDDSARLGAASNAITVSVTETPPPALVSIDVAPVDPTVALGGQQAFTATGTYSDASTQDLTVQVTWTSSVESVATIDAAGLASALAVGSTTITAALGEVSGTTLLTVPEPPPQITTVSLPDGSYGIGYGATLVVSGGTPPYTWAIPAGLPPGLSLDPQTGEISGIPLAGGVFVFTVNVTDATLQAGSVQLQISIPAVQNFTIWPETTVPTLVDGGPDAPVTVGVRFRSDVDGFISGLRFYKHPLNTGTHVGTLWTESGSPLGTATFTGESGSGWQQVNFGAPVPITANTVYIASYFVPNGHYSADTLYFQNAGVDSPPLHAPQSVFGTRNGLFAYGPASTFPDQSFNAANYWVDVVFTGQPSPPLVSIAVTPPSPSIETGGGTQQFLATGTYADTSTLDITSQVTWESDTPTVSTISATGLATALTPGSTTVTATLGTVSGTASLNVALGTLAITTTALPSIIVGLPYSATLAASGGVPPYTWSIASGLPADLVLNPATGEISGTPSEIGTFPFTAELSDTSAQNTSAPLSITVDPAPVLTSIAVTPATPTLDTGTSVPLTATGTYSNATQQNLTTLVTWSSSDGSVATVSPAGELTAWNPGSATVTATLGAVDGAASVTVNAGVPGATGGPGGPILVVTHEGNPYARYLVDILETEGFQAYTVMDVVNVSPATLAAYDVVVLGEFPLTAAQVSMLETWVNAGGNLIAMRPDKQLATLLGLSDLAATLPNGYLRVETASGPGAGIVGETIQYHGTSDVYALDGATQVAELYADATTATSSPAVTLHQPLLGRAAAFSYDLARSVVWTRQGNPAWSGQSRTGASTLRSVELFFGNAAGDPQPDWVNLDKVAIPQADEQQRLLANLILQMNLANKPLPRFWYLPFGHKAAVVMTGDDHANGGTAARFDAYANASVPACSVADWGCVRSTSYVFTGSLTAPQATAYEAAGFEVALLVDTGCVNWSSAGSLLTLYANQQTAFGAAYPGVPAPTTSRTNCIVWSDYDTQPAVELARGVRLDTNYYYFPGSWVQDRPGFMTGSGMPMRFTDRSGERIDVYQAATQMTAESGQSYPATVDTLLDGALGANGYYGVFTASMATDFASPVGPGADAWAGSNAIVASAQSRGVPVVSARQMLTWLDGKNGSSFGNLAWNGTVLSFTVAAAPGAENLRAMLPFAGPGVTFDGITQDGNPVPFFTETVKGVVYAIFPATTGAYEATYQ